jgi:predicted choloylglycine hydrolase
MRRRAFLKTGTLAAAVFTVNPWRLSYNPGESLPANNPVIATPESNDIPVLVLEGSPRKRGQIQGESLKSKICDCVNLWKEDIHKSLEIDPNDYISQFLEETDFQIAIEKWAPDLLEEVKGMAEASGLDFKTIFSYQLGDEDYWYRRNKILHKIHSKDERCSALGVFGQKNSAPLLAQNMDIESYYDGYEVLLHIKYSDSSLEAFVFTVAGYLALTGLNNQPVGICCNTLPQLDYSPQGLPVVYIVRTVLEKSNLAEAENFIHEIRHASGQNYTIGDSQRIKAFECSSNKVIKFTPYEGATRVYHTNHPLVNDDQSVYKELRKKYPLKEKRKGPSNSEVRFNFLEKELKDPSKKITEETIKSILGSHEVPICFHKETGGGEMTFGCLIMSLSSSPVLHLAPGPPCSTEFSVYKF